MLSKAISVIVATLIIVAGWLYLETSESYQSSFKAKFYQSIGNYELAHELSQRALELDMYNKQAHAILAQSQNALIIKDYVKQGEEYLAKIRTLSQSTASAGELERVKLMCEIIINEWERISKIKTEDSELSEQAHKIYENFSRLYKELF